MSNEKKRQASHASSFKKWALYFLLTILLVRVAYYAATEGFCPERICANSVSLGNQSETYVRDRSPTFPPELKNTSFRYLKKGSQAYAFESQDGKYVLKLFKRHHMQEALWLQNIPTFGPFTTWKDILLQKRKRKLELALNSYVIATGRLRKQCAILAYQLEPTNTSTLTVELVDGIGRKHLVSLNKCGYVLQQKASLVFPAFSRWIETRDFDSANKALRSLVSLIAFRSKLGIQDVDPDLHKNAGLLGNEAIFIDIGSFTQREKPLTKEAFCFDIKKISNELRLWLASKDESLAHSLDVIIEESIQKY